ncbi:MAG: hypothetical protein WC570_04815 [Patescibacteria group bacterium]
MTKKNIFYKVIYGLLLFFLVVAAGAGAWELSKPYRTTVIAGYLQQADRLVKKNDSMALWELEKAYFMGLDYPSYRQERAILLLELNDARATDELDWLVAQGWANDRVNFEEGRLAFLNKEYEVAWQYFGQMSKDSDPQDQGQALVMMAVMAGDEGNWSGVNDYLRQAGNKNYRSDLSLQLELALNIVLADWEQIDKMTNWSSWGDDEEQLRVQVLALESLVGDTYFIQSAQVLTDMGWPGWARAYLSNVDGTTLDQKDLYQVYAYTYLAGRDCGEALSYVKMAEQIDSTDLDTQKLLESINQCL